MPIAEKFIRSLADKYGKHVLCIEMVEHNIILKPVFFLKNTECFDDYYPGINNNNK